MKEQDLATLKALLTKFTPSPAVPDERGFSQPTSAFNPAPERITYPRYAAVIFWARWIAQEDAPKVWLQHGYGAVNPGLTANQIMHESKVCVTRIPELNLLVLPNDDADYQLRNYGIAIREVKKLVKEGSAPDGAFLYHGWNTAAREEMKRLAPSIAQWKTLSVLNPSMQDHAANINYWVSRLESCWGDAMRAIKRTEQHAATFEKHWKQLMAYRGYFGVPTDLTELEAKRTKLDVKRVKVQLKRGV